MTTGKVTTLEDFVLDLARSDARIWFYKPEWYWPDWTALLPITHGHDEYARRCLVIGWHFTGQIVIPLWDCGDPECKEDAIRNAYDRLNEFDEEVE